MNKRDWNESLNNIAPELVEEHIKEMEKIEANARKKPTMWLRYIAVAACVCFVFGAVALLPLLNSADDPIIPEGDLVTTDVNSNNEYNSEAESSGEKNTNSETEDTEETTADSETDSAEETTADAGIIMNVPPLDECTYEFSSYNELLSILGFVEGSTNILKNEMERYGLVYEATISAFESKKIPILIPHRDNSSLPLRNMDGVSSITLFTNELYNLPWIWYHCTYNDYDLRVQVSYVDILNNPEIHHTKSYREIISVIAPSAPSPDNYTEYSSYSAIYEQEIALEGRTVMALVSELKSSDNIYIQFHIDGVLVILYGNKNLLNNDFLNSFTLQVA